MAEQAPVGDKQPPEAVVKAMNPFVRAMLRSPLRRLAGNVAVLEFAGRRTGRTYKIPVGWHDVGDGTRGVFSAEVWRLNFRGGAPVTVRHARGTSTGTGTLVADTETVAAALQHALDTGSSASLLGLRIERDHTITPDDVRAVGRDLIRLDLTA